MILIMSKRRILYFTGLGIGLLLLLRQLCTTYREAQLQVLVVVRPVYLLGSILFVFLLYILQTVAWASTMRYLGATLNSLDILWGYWVSFLPRYIPGGLWGYWGRALWFQEHYGINYAISTAGSALEGMSLSLTALIISGVYISTNLTGIPHILAIIACVALFCFNWLATPRLVKLAIHKFTIRSGRDDLRSHQDILSLKWLPVTLLHMAQWVIYGVSVLLLVNAILPTVSDRLLGAIFSSSFSWLLGFVVVLIPAGIGIREITLSTLLSQCLGVPLWQANTIAIFSRVEMILAELGCLALGLQLYVQKWRKRFGQSASDPLRRQK